MKATATPNANFLDRLDAFQIKFGMRHLYLAMHAAFPISLTPNLLFILRDNFNRDNRGISLDIPWEAVSDILLSDFCQVVGYETFRMEAGMRHYLLARLESMSRFGIPRLQELNNFINQYFGASLKSHNPDQKALAEAQLWAAQLQVNEEKALEMLSRNLKTAIDQKDRSTQMRLHYLLDYFPLLEGEVADLRAYAKGNAQELSGLHSMAQDTFRTIATKSGDSILIGAEEFVFPEKQLASHTVQNANDNADKFTKELALEKLKESIKSKLIGNVNSKLSGHHYSRLEDVTGISHRTLRRFFETDHFLQRYYPQQKNLDLLSVFAGYESWNSFLYICSNSDPEFAASLSAERLEMQREVEEIQRQLRWLGLYDGQLNGDWETTSKVFLSDYDSDFPRDFGGTSSSLETFVTYAKKFIADRRQQLRTPTVYVQGCEQVITILKQVLDFWGVKPTEYSIHKELLDNEYPSRFNDVETAELILLGVDSSLLKSLRFQKILEIAERNSADIAPIILKECDWQNAGLGGFSPILDASEGLMRLDEKELLGDLQFGLGRSLLRLANSKKHIQYEEEPETDIHSSNPVIWLIYAKNEDQELANEIGGFLEERGMQTHFVDIRLMFLSTRPNPKGIVVLQGSQRLSWVLETTSRIERESLNRTLNTDHRIIYVGNLSYDWTEEQLQNLFSPYGKIISAEIMRDRDNPDRSRGFGFVTFSNPDDARSACIDVDNGGLDGADIKGRQLTVNIKRQESPRPPRYSKPNSQEVELLVVVRNANDIISSQNVSNWKVVNVDSFEKDLQWRKYFESINENQEPEQPLRVFMSYSNQDLEMLLTLRKHLSFLERSGRIIVWEPSILAPGDDWTSGIIEQLENADIIVVMVSADYFASNFVMEVELKVALERAASGTAKLFILVARHCDYQSTPLNQYAFANSALSLTSDLDLDRAFVRITKEFNDLVQNVALEKRASRKVEANENQIEISEEGPRLNPSRIMKAVIIDDDLQYSKDFLQTINERFSYYLKIVAVAISYDQALEIVAMEKPQILFMDLEIANFRNDQETHNQDFLKRISNFPSIEGIFYTSGNSTHHLEFELVQRFNESVTSVILEKPIAYHLFESHIAAIYERWQRKLSPDFTSTVARSTSVEKIVDDFIFVKGGSFFMGAEDLAYNDGPVHKVTLSDFYLCKYEVTQAQWYAVMGENPSKFRGNLDCPVEMVSWEDCQSFIEKLKAIGGLPFRLPTEAEWEFAARGGNLSKGYNYSGSDDIEEVGWYLENGGQKTHPVGEKLPNELGLFDMSGNVLEWCQDRFSEKYYRDSPENDPQGPDYGEQRVFRGGHYIHPGHGCRVSVRGESLPYDKSSSLGFRLAMDAEDPMSRIKTCIEMRDFEKGTALISQSTLYFGEDSGNWIAFMEGYFLLCMHTGHYTTALETYRRVTAHSRFASVTDMTTEKWHIFGGFLRYILNASMESVDTEVMGWSTFSFLKFLNEVPLYSKERRDLNISILILQILFVLDRRDFKAIRSRVSALKIYSSRYLKNDENYRSNCFLKMILLMEKKQFQYLATAKLTERYYSLLKSTRFIYWDDSLNGLEIIPYEQLWATILGKLRSME